MTAGGDGTPAMGKRHKKRSPYPATAALTDSQLLRKMLLPSLGFSRTHALCPRCGKRSYHQQNKKCVPRPQIVGSSAQGPLQALETCTQHRTVSGTMVCAELGSTHSRMKTRSSSSTPALTKGNESCGRRPPLLSKAWTTGEQSSGGRRRWFQHCA